MRGRIILKIAVAVKGVADDAFQGPTATAADLDDIRLDGVFPAGAARQRVAVEEK